jgi:electron transport complex protein RnfC
MRQSGLAGMGGSMFPYARKSRAAIDAKVHTLVVNGVECEPGVEIDEGILCHQHDLFLEGVNAVTKAFNISRRVVAVRKSASKRMAQALAQDGFELLVMPDTYPGGAGKLIVGKLLGRIPGTGIHNSALGCLVMCSTSLWALGRFIREGRPSIDRPLTIVAPGMTSRNMIVPIGTPISHILQTCNVPYDSTQHLLVAQGRMMGQAVTPDYTILKGSISLAVIPRTRRLFRREDPCILCGSCFDACPLHLHPIGMADRIREDRFTPSLTTQLNECFLCGACSAVCPSDIPLAEIFRKGKVCLKQTQKP